MVTVCCLSWLLSLSAVTRAPRTGLLMDQKHDRSVHRYLPILKGTPLPQQDQRTSGNCGSNSFSLILQKLTSPQELHLMGQTLLAKAVAAFGYGRSLRSAARREYRIRNTVVLAILSYTNSPCPKMSSGCAFRFRSGSVDSKTSSALLLDTPPCRSNCDPAGFSLRPAR